MKWAPELAEAFGTFALVFAACGAIAVNEATGALGTVGIALVFGLVIAAMIYAVGHVSGAHFNPAVTVAFAATHHFPWSRVPRYIGAQISGAVLGGLTLVAVLPEPGSLGVTQPGQAVSIGATLAIEIVLTTILMFVISAVATDGRAAGTMAGNAIGGTVALSAMWAGPLTGASMNPARSIGPAVAALDFAHLWVYLLGPLLGALIGAVLYHVIRGGQPPVRGE